MSIHFKGYQYLATYIIIAVIYLVLVLIATAILKFVAFKMDGHKVKTSLENILFHFKAKKEN